MEQLAVAILTAARAIGIGRTQIYALIARGELTKIKIGRRSLITTDSLRAFIERAKSHAQHRDALPNEGTRPSISAGASCNA